MTETAVRRHRFEPDHEASREYVPLKLRRQGVQGRPWCAKCGLPYLGADDARHTPPLDLDAASAEDRRRLGESDED